MKRILLGFFLYIFMTQLVSAQQADTLLLADTAQVHSPTKATLMSLVLPGLGQAYNKKYWKIPLVYAIIGVPLYFGLDQQSQFEEFKEAYVKRVDDDPKTMDIKYDGVYTDENLLSLIDFHRENRDLLFVLTGIAYAINIVDAAVDAHLYYFDVGDDLVGNFKPGVQFLPRQQTMVPSLTFTLKFAKNSHRKAY